jgi:hypothetical protein
MENINALIATIEKDFGTTLMDGPYRYQEHIHLNMDIDKYCRICHRRIGLLEHVYKNDQDTYCCLECHHNHITGVNIATYDWFKNLNLDLRDDLNLNWIPKKSSNILEFSYWLANYQTFKNAFYVAKEIRQYKHSPLIDAFYLPQTLETKALNLWLTEIGISVKDCTFRTLDTFKNFNGLYEDILVIYNNPNKTHSNRDNKPLNMKINSISELLGEQILGAITFINRHLVTPDTLDQTYPMRAPKMMKEVL